MLVVCSISEKLLQQRICRRVRWCSVAGNRRASPAGLEWSERDRCHSSRPWDRCSPPAV